MPTRDSSIASATDPVDGVVRGNAGRMQAYRIREVAFRMALDVAGVTIANPSDELCSRARDFAACVKAWSEADERGRIARGRPLPGSLRPERKPKSKPESKRTLAPTRERASNSPPPPPSPAISDHATDEPTPPK